MRSKLAQIAPVLAAGVVGAVLVALPISSATSIDESCEVAGGTGCQSPGHVQLNDNPGPAPFSAFGGKAFVLGGNASGGFRGVGLPGGGFGRDGLHGGHR